MSTNAKSAATFLRLSSPWVPMDRSSDVRNATKPGRRKYFLPLHRPDTMQHLAPPADHHVAPEDLLEECSTRIVDPCCRYIRLWLSLLSLRGVFWGSNLIVFKGLLR